MSIASIIGLIGSLANLVTALTPLLKGRGHSPSDRSWLARIAELFSDQRDRVSRRTTIAQLCALVACAFAIVLVSFASGHTAGHAASELGLLAVVGVFALIGATSGLNKVLVTWRERPQRVLVYVAGLGIVFSLAAWVSALSVTANIWSQ